MTTKKPNPAAVETSAPEAIKAVDVNQIERADVFGDLSQFRDTAAEAVEAVKRTLNRVPLMKAQGSGQRRSIFTSQLRAKVLSRDIGRYIFGRSQRPPTTKPARPIHTFRRTA